MIELKQQTEQKSFQRLDVEELERLLRLTDMQNEEKAASGGFFAKIKDFFSRH